MLEEARIDGHAHVVYHPNDFHQALITHSHDATVVFLGFRLPEVTQDHAEYFSRFDHLLDGLPTTLLVSSVGDADLMS